MEDRARLTGDELALGRQLRASMPGFVDSPTAILVTLPDSRVLLANRAIGVLQQRPHESLIGLPATRWLVRTERIQVEERHAQAGAGEYQPLGTTDSDTSHWTYHLQRPDGSTIAVRTSTIILRASDGRPMALISRATPADAPLHQISAVSGRLTGADADTLQEARDTIPDFADLPEPMTISSAEGRLLEVNRSFTRAYGWENAEVVGLEASALLAPHLRSWADQRLAQITGAPLLAPPSQPLVRHRDGRSIPSTASSVPVRTPAGEARYIVATVRPMVVDGVEAPGERASDP